VKDPRPKSHPLSPVQPGNDGASVLLLLSIGAVAAVAAWGWYNHSPDDTAGTTEQEEAAAPTGHPSAASVKGGGLPRLFSADDYPQQALDRDEQGTTTVRLTIGKNGRVKDCTVTLSSGFDSLDSASCRVLEERARFNPARDSNGTATEGMVVQRISWRLAE